MAKIDYSGQTIGGKYRIIKLLGKGGMGAVYLGEHVVIGKKIAVKFLHTEFTAKEDMVKRFYREAQVAAAISHRNIIDVMDVGVSQEGDPYIVMEYLEGESLADLLARKGPMDLPSACAILEPACLALSAAHAKGIVHRDLKPENIFIVRHEGERPTVKLIDLGVSKYMQHDGQSQLTQTGTFLGTPAYMAPEQIRGASDVNQSADLYSIGVIIYEMLTGQLPFKGTHYNELLLNVMTEAPTPPRENFESFPEQAEHLVLSLLEKEEEKRPRSAKEVLEKLQQFDDYENRLSCLEVFMGDLLQMTIAAGTLGGTNDSDGSQSMASDVLAKLAGETPSSRTPAGWSNTVTTPKRKNNVYVIAGIVVVLAVVIAGILIGLAGSDDDSSPNAKSGISATKPDLTPASSHTALPLTERDEGVEIKIEGHPEGAKIYYEDFLILENPFRVKRRKTVARIAVEAEGYKPFRVSVNPTKDQVVKAMLVPLPRESEAAPPPSPAVKSEQATEKKSETPADKLRKKRRKNRKNMIIAEEFE